MNKYYVAVHVMDDWNTWILSFTAKSINDCKDKVTEYFSNYLKDDTLLNMDYIDFLDELDDRNICISEIYDSEEL